MPNRLKRHQLEKALKGARRSFWLNLVLLIINGGIYIALAGMGTHSWFPIVVGGFCGMMAIVANQSEKAILVQLGREDEI